MSLVLRRFSAAAMSSRACASKATFSDGNGASLVQPADAVQDLKQTLEDVRNNPDLSEAARVNLVDRLQRASQTVDRTSRNVLVAQEQAQAEEARAAASLAVRAEALSKLDESDADIALMVEFLRAPSSRPLCAPRAGRAT